MKIADLTIHDNPIAQPYTEEEMTAAAEARNYSVGRTRLAERVLIDGARHGWLDKDGVLQKGFTYGGEMVDGKPFGAIHIFNTRTVYQQVPNREYVRNFLVEYGDIEEVMLFLLGKFRTDSFIKWCSTEPFAPELRRYLAEIESKLEADGVQPDVYLTEYGDTSCEIRAKAPDSGSEVVEDEE